MYNWHVFSTQDLAHWTDHGPVLSLATFSWAAANACRVAAADPADRRWDHPAVARALL